MKPENTSTTASNTTTTESNTSEAKIEATSPEVTLHVSTSENTVTTHITTENSPAAQDHTENKSNPELLIDPSFEDTILFREPSPTYNFEDQRTTDSSPTEEKKEAVIHINTEEDSTLTKPEIINFGVGENTINSADQSPVISDITPRNEEAETKSTRITPDISPLGSDEHILEDISSPVVEVPNATIPTEEKKEAAITTHETKAELYSIDTVDALKKNLATTQKRDNSSKSTIQAITTSLSAEDLNAYVEQLTPTNFRTTVKEFQKVRDAYYEVMEKITATLANEKIEFSTVQAITLQSMRDYQDTVRNFNEHVSKKIPEAQASIPSITENPVLIREDAQKKIELRKQEDEVVQKESEAKNKSEEKSESRGSAGDKEVAQPVKKSFFPFKKTELSTDEKIEKLLADFANGKTKDATDRLKLGKISPTTLGSLIDLAIYGIADATNNHAKTFLGFITSVVDSSSFADLDGNHIYQILNLADSKKDRNLTEKIMAGMSQEQYYSVLKNIADRQSDDTAQRIAMTLMSSNIKRFNNDDIIYKTLLRSLDKFKNSLDVSHLDSINLIIPFLNKTSEHFFSQDLLSILYDNHFEKISDDKFHNDNSFVGKLIKENSPKFLLEAIKRGDVIMLTNVLNNFTIDSATSIKAIEIAKTESAKVGYPLAEIVAPILVSLFNDGEKYYADHAAKFLVQHSFQNQESLLILSKAVAVKNVTAQKKPGVTAGLVASTYNYLTAQHQSSSSSSVASSSNSSTSSSSLSVTSNVVVEKKKEDQPVIDQEEKKEELPDLINKEYDLTELSKVLEAGRAKEKADKLEQERVSIKKFQDQQLAEKKQKVEQEIKNQQEILANLERNSFEAQESKHDSDSNIMQKTETQHEEEVELESSARELVEELRKSNEAYYNAYYNALIGEQDSYIADDRKDDREELYRLQQSNKLLTHDKIRLEELQLLKARNEGLSQFKQEEEREKLQSKIEAFLQEVRDGKNLNDVRYRIALGRFTKETFNQVIEIAISNANNGDANFISLLEFATQDPHFRLFDDHTIDRISEFAISTDNTTIRDRVLSGFYSGVTSLTQANKIIRHLFDQVFSIEAESKAKAIIRQMEAKLKNNELLSEEEVAIRKEARIQLELLDLEQQNDLDSKQLAALDTIKQLLDQSLPGAPDLNANQLKIIVDKSLNLLSKVKDGRSIEKLFEVIKSVTESTNFKDLEPEQLFKILCFSESTKNQFPRNQEITDNVFENLGSEAIEQLKTYTATSKDKRVNLVMGAITQYHGFQTILDKMLSASAQNLPTFLPHIKQMIAENSAKSTKVIYEKLNHYVDALKKQASPLGCINLIAPLVDPSNMEEKKTSIFGRFFKKKDHFSEFTDKLLSTIIETKPWSNFSTFFKEAQKSDIFGDHFIGNLLRKNADHCLVEAAKQGNDGLVSALLRKCQLSPKSLEAAQQIAITQQNLQNMIEGNPEQAGYATILAALSSALAGERESASSTPSTVSQPESKTEGRGSSSSSTSSSQEPTPQPSPKSPTPRRLNQDNQNLGGGRGSESKG